MPWPTKKLGEVLEYEQPTDYLVNSTEYRDNYPIPVLTAGKSFILGNTNETSGVFPKEKLPVIIFDDFTTAIKFVDFPFKVKSSAMKILHAKKDEVDTKFLFYKMETIKFAHDQHKRYWISEYSKIKIPLPPIGEQRRIVAKIEKLFAKIGEASRLRAESSAASAALLPSALHQVFSRAEKEGWDTKRLDEVAEFLDNQRKPINEKDRRRSMADKSQEELYPYYGANGQVGWIDYYIFDEELVLLAEDGGLFGSTSRPIAYKVSGKYWVNNHAHVLRPRSGALIDWLYYMIKIRPDVGDIVRGTTRAKLNQAQAKEIKIPLPSIAEQKKIVAHLDALSEKARALQELQKETAHNFSALRQGMLYQTFSGIF